MKSLKFSNEIYLFKNNVFHFKNLYISKYEKNYSDDECTKLLKFSESKFSRLSRLQETIFLEAIEFLRNENTLIILPPMKDNISPLPRIFEKICKKYSNNVIVIRSPQYDLKPLPKDARIEEIRRISKKWTTSSGHKINESTNFLYVDDIYTTGATLMGIIEFVERVFYSNTSGFRTIVNIKHINFDKIRSLFFCRTWPPREKVKPYISIDDNLFWNEFNTKCKPNN